MKQYKIRPFVKSKKSELVKFGISIPKHVTTFYPEGTYFKIDLLGAGSILLTSGAKVKHSKDEVKAYNFEDVRV